MSYLPVSVKRWLPALLALAISACGSEVSQKSLPAQDRCSLSEPEKKSYWANHSEAEAWAATSLRLQNAQKIFTTVNCYQNLRRFNGCIYGLNALLLRTTPLEFWHWAPKEEKKSAQHVELVRIKDISEERKKDERPEFESWRKVFSKNPKINFAELFDATIAKFKELGAEVTSRNNAFVAATLINGYLEGSLDPHTGIFPKSMVRTDMDLEKRSRVGIGIHIEKLTNTSPIIVKSVRPGSPSEGILEPEDQILEVDGTSIQALGASELSDILVGNEGCAIRFKIKRERKVGPPAELTLSVVRKKLAARNVFSSEIRTAKSMVGVIQITDFMAEQTADHFKIELDKFLADKRSLTGLIIDLRGNGGGRIDQVTKIATWLLPEFSTVVSTRLLYLPEAASEVLRDVFPDDTVIERLPDPPIEDVVFGEGGLRDIPQIAVLIDRNSASASEILTGALRDNGVAFTVGERSHGKGTIQVPYPLPSIPGVEIHLTRGAFFLPLATSNQVNGIASDFESKRKRESNEGGREENRFNALSFGKFSAPPRKEKLLSKIRDCLKSAPGNPQESDDLTLAVAALECAAQAK